MNTEDINWGVPVTRTVSRKEERFTTPVLSMRAITAPGISRKMTFNKAAKEQLGLVGKESNVRIGFKGESIFLMNVGAIEEGEEAPAGTFLLTGDLSFADKKVFNHIASLLSLDINNANHLFLENVEGKPFMTVSGVQTDVVETEAKVEETEEVVIETAPVKESKKITVSIPEVKPEPKPERVAFAIDETEEDNLGFDEAIEKAASEAIDDEEEWN